MGWFQRGNGGRSGCRRRLRLITGRGRRWGRSGAGHEDHGRECEGTRDDGVTMKQSASHDAAPRMLRASRLESDAELACRAGDRDRLGGRALWDETHRGLQTAGMLFETDVLVVVNGDLVLGAEQARCSEG